MDLAALLVKYICSASRSIAQSSQVLGYKKSTIHFSYLVQLPYLLNPSEARDPLNSDTRVPHGNSRRKLCLAIGVDYAYVLPDIAPLLIVNRLDHGGRQV
jgi:hypothetical protein